MNIVNRLSWFIHRKSNVKKICEVNYLSEKQAQEALQKYTDATIWNTLREMQNEPDCAYLTRRLIPDVKEPTVRKTFDPKDIVRATILGDIIGSKYEFVEHDYERIKTIKLPAVSSRFTDDTVLSVATMNAILKNPNNPDFATEYKKAYKAHPHAGYGSSFVTWAMDDSAKHGYHSLANGSAMRVSFIPAYYENVEDVIKYTIMSAMTTHNHVEGVKGAVVISVCIWMALHGYSKNEIWKYCKSHYHVVDKNLVLNKKYYFDINQPIDATPSRNTLFCSYIVPYVVKCFYGTNSYEECMRELLSHFGDTDTLCAVAGGLCYAYYDTTGLDMKNILNQHSVNI